MELISRQAAIDAVARVMVIRSRGGRGNTIAEAVDSAKAIIADNIRRLPPIQPEIVRCRECKFASGDSRICMKFGHSPIGELDFCAWAERRTDE